MPSGVLCFTYIVLGLTANSCTSSGIAGAQCLDSCTLCCDSAHAVPTMAAIAMHSHDWHLLQ